VVVFLPADPLRLDAAISVSGSSFTDRTPPPALLAPLLVAVLWDSPEEAFSACLLIRLTANWVSWSSAAYSSFSVCSNKRVISSIPSSLAKLRAVPYPQIS
jgi:hypothetical protein